MIDSSTRSLRRNLEFSSCLADNVVYVGRCIASRSSFRRVSVRFSSLVSYKWALASRFWWEAAYPVNGALRWGGLGLMASVLYCYTLS